MAGTSRWHKYNSEEQINASNHVKFKGKKYARPLILTKKEWAAWWYTSFKQLNPEFKDKTDEEISAWWENPYPI